MIRAAIDRVSSTQTEQVARAADLMTATLQAGGVIQAFGCGHSEALAMEIAGRAGGLVPTNRIALRDIVLYGGEPPASSATRSWSATRASPHRLYDLAPVKPDDVVRHRLQLRRQRRPWSRWRSWSSSAGTALIAITSLEPHGGVDSRHPSGTQADRPRRRGPRQRRAVRRRGPAPARRRRRLRGLLDHRGPAGPAGRHRGGAGGCWRPAAPRRSTCPPTSPAGDEHNQHPGSAVRRAHPAYRLTERRPSHEPIDPIAQPYPTDDRPARGGRGAVCTLPLAQRLL